MFYFASFFMMILLLNLLIALMGDSFDRINEIQESAYLQELSSFIAEYSYLFPHEKFSRRPYIVYLKQLEEDEDDPNGSEVWHGKLKDIKNSFKRLMTHLQKEMAD